MKKELTIQQRRRLDRLSLDTVAGKLKSYCPSLFYSLSAWERDSLDPSIVLEAETSQATFSGDRIVGPGGVKHTWGRLILPGWGGGSDHYYSSCGTSGRRGNFL
jgi:hypothetical protein